MQGEMCVSPISQLTTGAVGPSQTWSHVLHMASTKLG